MRREGNRRRYLCKETRQRALEAQILKRKRVEVDDVVMEKKPES
jgi:hypothetical protein